MSARRRLLALGKPVGFAESREPESTQGSNQLQFQINDQSYFLHFEEGEGRWYVMTGTAGGIRRIPVVHDRPEYGPARYVIQPGQDENKFVN